MFLDLTGDERGCPDGGKMVSASTAPPSSSAPSAAATSRRGFLLRVHLWLIGIIVDVVMALHSGDQQRRKKKRGKVCV